MKLSDVIFYSKSIISSADCVIVYVGSGIFSRPTMDFRSGIKLSELESCKIFGLKNEEAWDYYLKKHQHNLNCQQAKSVVSNITRLLEDSVSYRSGNYIVITSNTTNSHLYGKDNRLSSEKIIELNGSMLLTQCNGCKSVFSIHQIDNNNTRCKACNSFSRPNIRLSISDKEWKGNPYISSFQKKYFEFLTLNQSKHIVMIELGNSFGFTQDSPNNLLIELSSNLLFDESKKVTSIRINPFRQSKVMHMLTDFIGLEDDEMFHDSFNIDEYLGTLKNTQLSNLTKKLGLKMSNLELFTSRMIDGMIKMRAFEQRELEACTNEYFEINLDLLKATELLTIHNSLVSSSRL